MPIKPTPEAAMRRLRLDTNLSGDLADAIEQAHGEALAFLDGALYESEADKTAAQDPRGIVCTPDIISAQLLLVDVLVGNNSLQDRESKQTAAETMLRRHRNLGA